MTTNNHHLIHACPQTPRGLWLWVRDALGYEIPWTPLLPTSRAPFEYLIHTFFEGAFPTDQPAPEKTRPDPERASESAASPCTTSFYSVLGLLRNLKKPQNTSNNLEKPQKTTPEPQRTSNNLKEPQKTSATSPVPSSPASAIRHPASGISPSPSHPITVSPSHAPHPLHALDAIVWANRGGGKTFLAAIATLLDLLFKPAIHVTILGGSLEQSQRMHEHLRRFFEVPALATRLAAPITDRKVILTNKSRATVLAQSQASVRGTRVQKLRCDEVDLFDPHIWSAVQLTTRSLNAPGPWGPTVRGSIDALSTMHQPHGLMWQIVTSATAPSSPSDSPSHPPRTLFRWGLLDTLHHCPPHRDCQACPLHPDCQGRAKSRTPPAGHISIDDAIRMQSRVSAAAWKSEMLCLTPRRTDSVYPEFDRNLHVGDWPDDLWRTAATEIRGETLELGYSPFIAGMDFGFRAPTVILLAWVDGEGALRIEAEHVEAERTLDYHIRVLTQGSILSSPANPLTPATQLPRPAWVGADPAGGQTNPHTGISSNNQLRKAGLKVKDRRLELLQGVELIRARLKTAAPSSPLKAPTPLRLNASPPKLLIHKRCEKLIDALERYHFPEDNPHALEPVKDGHDHCADALRYLVVNLDKPYAPLRVIRYA